MLWKHPLSPHFYISLYLTVGLDPAGLQALQLPSLETEIEEEPGDSDRDINGLIDGGILPKVSWSNTPPCAADSEQEIAAVFTTWGRRRLPFIEGIDIRLSHQLPGTN